MAKGTAEAIETTITTVMAKVLPDLMTQMVQKFEICLNKLVETFEEKLRDRCEILSSELYTTNVRVDQLEKKLVECEKVLDKYKVSESVLTSKLSLLETRVDDQEQYFKRDNLIIHGVPEIPGENCSTTVIDICQKYLSAVKIVPSDISVSHRLPSRSERAKPLIVRFTRRDVRQQIYHNKKNLKSTGFTVVEQLTARRQRLMSAATKLMNEGKLTSAWTNDGRIFVKLHDGTIKNIQKDSDLTM